MQESRHSTSLQKLVKFVPPPHQLEEEVTLVMIEKHISPQVYKQSNRGRAGSLKPDDSQLGMIPLDVGEEVGTNVRTIDEVP